MAVKMRLRREGKKKQPFYRIVVADVRSPRDGRFIEDIGYYQPLHNPSTISINSERALYWLRNGVQPSDAVVNLLRIEGIWEEFKPGDTGKDRSSKNQAREADRVAKAKAHEALVAKQAAERAAKDAEANAAQAHEENLQPDAGATEDTGAIDEATGEVTAPEGDAPAQASDAPAEASDASAEASDASAEASDAPAEASDAPAEASDAPVEASDSPVEAEGTEDEA